MRGEIHQGKQDEGEGKERFRERHSGEGGAGRRRKRMGVGAIYIWQPETTHALAALHCCLLPARLPAFGVLPAMAAW